MHGTSYMSAVWLDGVWNLNLQYFMHMTSKQPQSQSDEKNKCKNRQVHDWYCVSLSCQTQYQFLYINIYSVQNAHIYHMLLAAFSWQ